MRKNNWVATKKLLVGSLIALSSDYDNSVLIGIVRARDNKKMNETQKDFGFVEIEIEIMSGESPIDVYTNY